MKVSENLNLQRINKNTSRRITSLRYILVILVIFVHNNFRAENFIGKTDAVFNQSFIGKWVQIFISDGIALSAVPLFFLFSSYLQFKKNDVYGTLLVKKINSLVIPFFLWPLLNIGISLLVKFFVLKIHPALLSKGNEVIKIIPGGLKFFFGINLEAGNFNDSYLIQFWFIRNLFVLIVFSPLVHFCVQKSPVCSIIIVAVLHFSVKGSYFVYFATCSIFYYTLGILWAEYDFDLFSFVDKIKWKALIPSFLSVFIYSRYFPSSLFFLVLTGCLVLLKFSFLLERNEKIFEKTKFLGGFSFWLFAIHMPFLLRSIQKIWFKFLPMRNGFLCLLEYFGVVFLTAFIGTFAGIVLRKICPKCFRVLNGGR